MLSAQRRRIIDEFEKFAPESFWGSPFDVRFYLASRIKEIRNGLMLDIGSGPGILLNERDHRKVLGIGIDISRDSLRTSREVDNSLQCVLSDMHYLPFRDEAFDYVVVANSFSSFEMEIDPRLYPRAPYRMLVDEVSRVLSNNGQFLATTPNRNHRYYRNKKKVDYRTLKTSLRRRFNIRISGFNPIPITLPAILDVEPVNTLYLALLRLLLKLPFSKYLGMFFFVECTKKSSYDRSWQ